MDMLKNAVQGAVVQKVAGPPIWQSGICDCAQDLGMCCQTIWCTYCTLANMNNQRDFRIGAFDCGACCGIMLGSYISGYDLINWMAIGYRREIIQRYGIQNETVCKSCCIGLFCMPCSLCQVQREMGKRNEHCGGCCANPPPAPSMADKVMSQIGGALNTGMNVPRVWGSGMCGCSCMECLEAIFCYPCVFGFMANRLDAGRVPEKPAGIPNQMDIGACCGILWYPYGPIYAHRREIIERYNIGGETHNWSWCYLMCCTPCVFCQQRREMGYANEWPGGICVTTPPVR